MRSINIGSEISSLFWSWSQFQNTVLSDLIKDIFSNFKSQVCWSQGQFKHFVWSDSGASIRCYERFTALYGCGTRQKPWLSQNCRREIWWNFKTSDRLEAQFKTIDNLLFWAQNYNIDNILFFYFLLVFVQFTFWPSLWGQFSESLLSIPLQS